SVLALPFSEYRVYSWNHDRTVIDPAPRYLGAPVLADDTLVVGPITVEGENAQAAAVRRLLAAGEPGGPSGARWGLVEHRGAGGAAGGKAQAVLSGLTRTYQGEYLDLYANPAGQPSPVASMWRRVLQLAAYVCAAGVLFAGFWYLRRRPTPW